MGNYSHGTQYHFNVSSCKRHSAGVQARWEAQFYQHLIFIDNATKSILVRVLEKVSSVIGDSRMPLWPGLLAQ